MVWGRHVGRAGRGHTEGLTLGTYLTRDQTLLCQNKSVFGRKDDAFEFTEVGKIRFQTVERHWKYLGFVQGGPSPRRVWFGWLQCLDLPFCLARSSAFSKGAMILSTVRKAARFAV